MYKLVSRSLSLKERKDVSRREAAKAHVPDEPKTVSDETRRTPSYNDSARPPSDASKNTRHLHHASRPRRPLLAKPPSTANMADRPRTSTPDTMTTATDSFKLDKRASRDDFYHDSRAFRGTRAGPLMSTRDNLPTPDASPRAAPAVQRFAFGGSSWELATNPMAKLRNGDIGMALGSPSHPPIFSDTWNPRNAAVHGNDSHLIASPPTSRSSSMETLDMPASKKATGKWKLFSIFTRKQSYQSAPAVSVSDPDGLHSTNRPEEEARMALGSHAPPLGLMSPARTGTPNPRKTAKSRPIIARSESETVPTIAKTDEYDQNPIESETQDDGNLEPIPIALDKDPKDAVMAGPLLNVEIPDVRLERYSVMFNSVLNSNPPLSFKRQASMQKLRGIEDTVEREEGEDKVKAAARRVTSPQLGARSSGLALFPTNIQGQNPVPQKLSPRLRANTSPSLLTSPSQATFYSVAPRNLRQSIEKSGLNRPRRSSLRRRERPGIVITKSDHTEEETRPMPRAFGNGEPRLVFDSPAKTEPISLGATTRPVRKPKTRHLSPESGWRIIDRSPNTPLTASSANARSHRKRSPSRPSSYRKHAAQLSDDFDTASSCYSPEGSSTGENTAKIIRPVEISVARQISISRQRRKLLQPPRPEASATVTLTSTSPSRRPLHANPVGMPGEKGRLAKTKTSTPTLVHPPDTLDPRLAQLPQHRRSEQVVLEDA
ncbi:hypothetical protein F5Y14DRAFT_96658 [Nemania sp. NC0429]|nr:hypothetical protein F5Y14DRAFT_96658 [Nemania sp. NC0429]